MPNEETGKTMEILLDGCLMNYYHTLSKAGYKPVIDKKLCYPTKEPPKGFKKISGGLLVRYV
jgi:hypothetical protein